MYFVRKFLLFLLLSSCAYAEYDPPAVYLTWIRHPESTMMIQWITSNDRADDTIEYRVKEETQWKRAIGTHQPMPNGYPYFIHRVELTDLQPATTYTFRPGTDAVAYQFRTLPADLKGTSIRFVEGGDVYHDGIQLVEEMNRQAAQTSPDFALVGGDIAYTAGHLSLLMRFGLIGEKLDRWLEWLKSWKRTMVTPDGRLIPMITAIGNHDVVAGFDQTADDARFFYALFAKSNDRSYQVLDFGNYMSLILLDTGHTNSISGTQTKWLEEALETRQTVPHKFALYHVGAYPSAHKDTKYGKQVRKHWVPLFEKYGLDVAFEHHEHTYKRTHPIRKDAIDPTGVIYMGDGCWGVAKPRRLKPHWYLSKAASTRHIIVVTLDSQQRRFTVLNPKGEVVDEIRMSIKNEKNDG